MKAKKKIARDAGIKWHERNLTMPPTEDYFTLWGIYSLGFEEGFEKAKSLLALKWRDHCQMNPCHCDQFVGDCESLGEEEIENVKKRN